MVRRWRSAESRRGVNDGDDPAHRRSTPRGSPGRLESPDDMVLAQRMDEAVVRAKEPLTSKPEPWRWSTA